MTEDEIARYLHSRIDQRAYQVGWLEQTIRSAINALEHSKKFEDWNQVSAVIEALRQGLTEHEAEAAQFAERSGKMDRPENTKPI